MGVPKVTPKFYVQTSKKNQKLGLNFPDKPTRSPQKQKIISYMIFGYLAYIHCIFWMFLYSHFTYGKFWVLLEKCGVLCSTYFQGITVIKS
jgi:hypothetical protein